MTIRGLIEKPDLSTRKSRLDQERNTLTEQIAHIQLHETQQRIQDQVMGEFTTYCDMIQIALDDPTPQVKQEVLRLLIKEIIVGNDTVIIKHIIPIDDFSRLLPRDNSLEKPQPTPKFFDHTALSSYSVILKIKQIEVEMWGFRQSN